LAAQHRTAAAELYWQAFGEKLGFVLGPTPHAMAFLTRVMRLENCISALDDQGNLIGIAGFKNTNGGFAGGAADDLRAVYGRIGAAWRLPLLVLISDDDPRFIVEGICVTDTARGNGVGTALIGTLCAIARADGCDQIRLDVVDTNWRAQGLYARLGFRTEQVKDIGWLRFAFGFRRAVVMVRNLSEAN
jgi:ribosomal protein S18 acetylase RimI-like enzyme